MSFGRTVTVVARTSLLRTRRRPSSWAIALATLLPAGLAALVGGVVGHGGLDAGAGLAIRLVGPLLAVALVSGAVGEQYENRTATYWMIRPIARPAVPLGDWLGSAALLVVLLAVAGALTVAAGALSGGAPPEGAPQSASGAGVVAALALEGLVLAGFCTGVATLVPRHPLIAAVGILTGTEGLVRFLPGGLKNGSLTYALERIAGLAQDAAGAGGDADSAAAMVNAMGGAQATHEAPLAVAFVVVAVYALAPMLLATQIVRERDLA